MFEEIMLCDHCIAAIKGRGEKLFVGPRKWADRDYDDDPFVCEWCEEEVEEVSVCHF